MRKSHQLIALILASRITELEFLFHLPVADLLLTNLVCDVPHGIIFIRKLLFSPFYQDVARHTQCTL